MSAQTKIIVLRMKKLVITGVIIGISLFLILLFAIIMLMKNPTDPSSVQTSVSKEAIYIPGVYNADLLLGGENIQLELTVDSDRIITLRLSDLSDTITTMYPLLEPTFESLCTQIYKKQSLENITYSRDTKYTSIILLDAIQNALAKARILNALPVHTTP